ncbi:MAG: hypothetical protein H7336_07465 [Bacteriovorax sp.]|nr:hypothetical protein [Bacteriovorax sp.]
MDSFNNKPQQYEPFDGSASPMSGEASSTPVSAFNPSEFFIPGWKGEGLITASAIVIKNSLSNLTIDAQALFKKSCSSSKSMKLQTYNEFMHFAEYANLDKSLLGQQNDFWLHVQDETSPLKKHIEDFLKVHCFRAVAIYLFRIKFIMDLAKEQRLNVSEDVLMNPLSFLGRIFVKDSSTELMCDSLQINQYSWYRPTMEYKDSLVKLKDAFENVTLTELIKLISTPKDDKIYSIRNYSHSLSHLTFGLLVNDLLLKFPAWLKPEHKKKTFSEQKLCLLPKTINTRFAGNNVSSMALSHWLAQESSIKLSQWSNLICPEFEGAEFIDGQFLKICQELQFLSFLTRVGAEHKYEIIPFICKIMREKYKHSPDDRIGQASFFNLGELPSSDTLYNRIVLNLTELPKTNPHHFLIQQILAQKPLMKKDAVVYVFTNQKLFVPSHSDRVEQLLKDFKVEAQLNMEELKGKGEIAHFAYILTRRTVDDVHNKHLFNVSRKVKESCLSFEFKGNLTRFNKFNKLVEELQTFMKHKNPVTTPIFVTEIEKDIHFEFHQDAIMDGKLVSSVGNHDSSHLPHPSFFKNLTKSSTSLDTFFNIELIVHEDLSTSKKNVSSELLGLKFGPEKQYPLLLIINQNDPMDVKLELTPIDSYRGKLEQYGTAFHSYFGLIPKHPSINLNVFREYFLSVLGHQIIQLQLSDGLSKLKAKLKSLLVPNFFASTQFMPNNIKSHFNILDLEASDLRNLHPEEMKAKYNTMKSHLQNHSKDFPWHVLSLLSHFKLQINSLVEQLSDDKPQSFNFSNSLIGSELVKLKTNAIYPKNEDVYVEYKIKNNQDLQLPMTSLLIKNTDDTSVLIFKFQEKEIIHLHSTPVMIHFIKFILQNAMGVKIADILLNLKVPAAKDLMLTTKSFENLKATNITLLKETEELIAFILRTEVSR